MDWVERIAEERIQRALEQGAFENNPYRGRRVPLEPENPHLPRSWWAAFHLLKVHDLPPPWMLRARMVREAIEAWRQALARALRELPPGPARRRALQRLRDQMQELNRHIQACNLGLPRGVTPMAPLDWDRECRHLDPHRDDEGNRHGPLPVP